MSHELHAEQLDKDRLVDVFNPTRIPFERTFQGEMYTIPPRSSITVKKYIADHLSIHLADRMVSNNKIILQKDKLEALKKIRLYE